MIQSRSLVVGFDNNLAYPPFPSRTMEQLVERKRNGCRDLYVDWKNSRKTQVFLNSPKSTMLKVSIPNTYQMVDIRKSKYIGFFRFSKINCGNNFIDAVIARDIG